MLKKILVLALLVAFLLPQNSTGAKTLWGMTHGERTKKIVAQAFLIDSDTYVSVMEDPKKIPWEKFNRIYIAFAAVNERGQLIEGKVNTDEAQWKGRLNNIVAQCRVNNPKAEIFLMSERGEGAPNKNYLMAASDPENFAHTVYRLLQTYDLDGFDLGWQNKMNINDYSFEVIALLEALRNKFDKVDMTPRGKKYKLTYSVWPGSQLPQLVAKTRFLVDQINIMSYGTAPKYSLDYYSHQYREAGFPYEKMIGGVISDVTFDDFAAGYQDNIDSVQSKCATALELNMAGMFAWRLDDDYCTVDGVNKSGAPTFRVANWLWNAMTN
ncbi:MAG: glycosyl hydrolase family 18 protein [Negativicutes bacterium]|jgi:GH18 family chitinase